MCLKRRRLFRYIIAAAFLTYLIILIYKLFILKVHMLSWEIILCNHWSPWRKLYSFVDWSNFLYFCKVFIIILCAHHIYVSILNAVVFFLLIREFMCVFLYGSFILVGVMQMLSVLCVHLDWVHSNFGIYGAFYWLHSLYKLHRNIWELDIFQV